MGNRGRKCRFVLGSIDSFGRVGGRVSRVLGGIRGRGASGNSGLAFTLGANGELLGRRRLARVRRVFRGCPQFSVHGLGTSILSGGDFLRFLSGEAVRLYYRVVEGNRVGRVGNSILFYKSIRGNNVLGTANDVFILKDIRKIVRTKTGGSTLTIIYNGITRTRRMEVTSLIRVISRASCRSVRGLVCMGSLRILSATRIARLGAVQPGMFARGKNLV